jgi:E1A/CREB-binding protein
MAGSGSFYAIGSTPLTTANSQSMNVANLQSRSSMNQMLVSNQLNIQSVQQQSQIKNGPLDQTEKVNFQSTQLTHDQLLHQHPMSQHQVQPNSQFIQNQYHINQQQPNSQHQQAMLRNNSLKQSQMASNHSMQLPEQGTLPHTELVSSQASDPADLPNFQGQYQQRNALDNVKGGQMLGHLSSSQNFHPSASHGSQQLLPSNPQLDNGSNAVSYVLKGSQTEQMLLSQWQPQTMEKAPVATNSSLEKQVQEDFCQRIMSQDGVQQPFSSDWCLSNGTLASVDPAVPKPTTGGFGQVKRNIHYLRQIKWLLLLFHAKTCTYPVGSCKFNGCVQVQELLNHFQNCQRKDCSYRSCTKSKAMSHHYKTCVDEQCPVCSVVRKFLRQSTEQASKQKALESRKLAQQNVSQRIMNGIEGDRMDVDPMSAEAFEDQPSVPKRLKMHLPSLSGPENDISVVSNHHVNPGFLLQEAQPEQLEHNNRTAYLKREVDAKADIRAPQKPIKISYDIDENVTTSRHNVIPGVPSEMDSHIKQENLSVNKETSETALEVKNETNDLTDATVTKSGKPKIKGVSMIELFYPDEVDVHIDSLKLWVGQVWFS